MKTIRKNLPKVSLFMCATLLFFSCEQYEMDEIERSGELAEGTNFGKSTGTDTRESSKYSGEDIFSGLFFFQNDIPANISSLKQVKAEIDEMKGANAEFTASLTELSEISVAYINQKYPGFFSELQRVMYSGNLYEIEAYLNKSVKMIEQSVLSSEKYSAAFIVGNKIENDETLKDQILSLDLTNEEDVARFKKIVADVETVEDVELAWVWAVAAAVYMVAAAVSMVVAAYSVVTKAAYWDVFEIAAEQALFAEESSISKEVTIAEIGDFFTGKMAYAN